jgi:hypothetical protein
MWSFIGLTTVYRPLKAALFVPNAKRKFFGMTIYLCFPLLFFGVVAAFATHPLAGNILWWNWLPVF